MTLSPRLRKLTLTVHVATSVGWLGVVAGYLVLAITGVTSQDAPTVSAAYLAMELLAWNAVIPLALASLATGLVSSLTTPWGLIQHYWVLIKLCLTSFATVVLLLQLGPITALADHAAAMTLAGGALDGARLQQIAHAGGGIIVLLVVTALSVYKPRGLTPFGQRRVADQRPAAPVTGPQT